MSVRRAKLGRAVEHASLTFHKQVLYPVGGNRWRDFEDRVRDQVSPLPLEGTATIPLIHATVPTELTDTILSMNRRRPPLLEAVWLVGRQSWSLLISINR